MGNYSSKGLGFVRAIAVGLLMVGLAALASSLQFVSLRDGSLAVPTGGNEDSGQAMVSADGRYVLFSSMAENLTIITNPAPQSGLLPRRQNVFLRDRLSQVTALVSFNALVNSGGNGDSVPAGISTNGQLALFESAASDLVADDNNNAADIFLRDVANGTNLLISVRTNGGSGNGVSRNATMTSDGRYIAFVSAANNLVPNDTNGIPDVFVRDRMLGVTTLVSAGARSTITASIPGGSSESPEITADGRYVAFFSTATNLISGITNVGEIYLRDLVAGTTTMVSTNARTLLQSTVGTSNGVSCNHRISDDGRYVAFVTATNPIASAYSRGIAMRRDLLTGVTQIIHTNANVPSLSPEDIRTLDLTPDGRFVVFVANTNIGGSPAQCIYRWDGQTATLELVSQNLTGGVSAGTSCDWPTLDASGRYVAFVCSGANLVTNALVGSPHLYVRDMQSGRTELISQGATRVGYPVNTISAPTMSADGQVVVFDAGDAELVMGDNNSVNDVFARNRAALATELISRRDAALPHLTATGPSGSGLSSVSTDGRFVAFASEGQVTSTANASGFRNVYVRDLFLAKSYLVSAATNGLSGNGNSMQPSISGDGRYVAFSSYANNLVPGDTNNFADVFVRDLQTGVTSFLRVSSGGDSQRPSISADGRYVTFVSGSVTTGENLFQRDLQMGIIRQLTAGGVGSWSQTPDGSRVAFIGKIPGDGTDRIYVWNTATAARIYTNTALSPSVISISANGERIAYLAGVSISLNTAHLVSNTNGPVGAITISFPRGLRLSSDGRYLVYSTTTPLINDSNAVSDVWLYDFFAGAYIQVCRRFYDVFTPNGSSGQAEISPDGRFVAYRSFATNAVVNDGNSSADVLLFDRVNNATFLVSRASTTNRTASGPSSLQLFSGDGRTLVFTTWASDLQSGDYNNGGDVISMALPTTALTDTDGDQMDDTWEANFFGTLARNGSGDFDGDGASDVLEFQTLTNPTNQASAFRADLSLSPNPKVSWPALPWKSYDVQYTDGLESGAWNSVSNTASLTGGLGGMIDPVPGLVQRYYRVQQNR